MSNIKQAIVDPSQVDSELIKALEQAGIDYVVQDEVAIKKNYRAGKKQLVVVDKKGDALDTCATISDHYICCNVKVLKSISNCPYDCSYCFLQNYLNDGNTKVVGNDTALIEEVKEACFKQPDRIFRIGTWELGDSLALEHETGQAQRLITAFRDIPNAVLELKTKSDSVNPILNCDHQHKTVVSWSLNANTIVETQEHKTARLQERLIALKKVTEAGYLVGLHVDPMIYFEGWEADYESLIRQAIQATRPDQIAWISLGSLRFNPEMKKKIETNFPASTITYTEMIRGNDGKMRYPKPLRMRMYGHVINVLADALGCDDLSPQTGFDKPLFYFCMERWDVWHDLLGASPTSIQDLDYLFAQSLQSRFFPSLPIPNKADYAV
ncbi:DNA photolyase [bacterium]|nr:DNA photolyase [bacterium]|tara:strand:+ start:696 stop:1841 length:1146 start_codon:yes stop_codon:yes gene_type:complete